MGGNPLHQKQTSEGMRLITKCYNGPAYNYQIITDQFQSAFLQSSIIHVNESFSQ